MSRILAIDYGTKNIGLAISDDEQRVALPYQTIKLTNLDKEKNKLFEDLKQLAKLEKIEYLLVGLPLTSQARPTQLGKKVIQFASELEKALGLPVEVMDERSSTKLAGSLVHRTARNIHELSAQIILQDYLDKLKINNDRLS